MSVHDWKMHVDDANWTDLKKNCQTLWNSTGDSRLLIFDFWFSHLIWLTSDEQSEGEIARNANEKKTKIKIIRRNIEECAMTCNIIEFYKNRCAYKCRLFFFIWQKSSRRQARRNLCTTHRRQHQQRTATAATTTFTRQRIKFS